MSVKQNDCKPRVRTLRVPRPQVVRAIALAAIAGASLPGCGGSGGAAGNTTYNAVNSATPAVPDTGGMMVLSPNGQIYALTRADGQNVGALYTTPPLVQAVNRSLAALGSYSLKGSNASVLEINGDTSYALGRWRTGEVYNYGTLQSQLNRPYSSWHYVVANRLTSLPVTGVYTCDAGTFTSPSYSGAGSTAINPFGTTTGLARIVVNGSGVQTSITLSTMAGSASGQVALSGVFTAPLAEVTGQLVTTKAMLGAGTGGQLRLIGMYETVLNDASHYVGTFSFGCSPV